MLSSEFGFCSTSRIWIDRAKRQRRSFSTDDLDESIRQRGIINPLILTREFELKAGERRLSSAIKVGLETVPFRFVDSLDPIELQILELEENLKRQSLHWRDEVRAMHTIHELLVQRTPDWTQAQTAQLIGLTPPTVTQYLRVGSELDNPKLAAASSYGSAYNLLTRVDERKIGDAMADIIEAGMGVFDRPKAEPQPLARPNESAHTPSELLPKDPPQPYAPPALPESILNLSFLEWAPVYSGPKFNFIHCDFPYGIDAFAGSQGAAGAKSSSDVDMAGAQRQLYDDSPDTYWTLCECFCAHLDRFMSPTGHVMFWFSMQHYTQTLEFFRTHAPSLTFNPMPLIWLKSDNRGIISDARRGPRNVIETALFAYREDRPIIRSVSNGYAAPTDKLFHHSAKPEPVLNYFFQMFVDESTRMLDPTCGGGSALRSAETRGARDVLGLELNPEHCENARKALRQFRVLRKASKLPSSPSSPNAPSP